MKLMCVYNGWLIRTRNIKSLSFIFCFKTLRFFLHTGNRPTFTNLGTSVTFLDDTGPNTLLYTVTSTDLDSSDVLTMTMTTSTTSFTFDTTTG